MKPSGSFAPFSVNMLSRSAAPLSAQRMLSSMTSSGVFGPGDVVVIPGGTEQGWFPEDTEVIDFFAPPRDDFLVGGKPAYISEG
jgi:hypothetical protein